MARGCSLGTWHGAVPASDTRGCSRDGTRKAAASSAVGFEPLDEPAQEETAARARAGREQRELARRGARELSRPPKPTQLARRQRAQRSRRRGSRVGARGGPPARRTLRGGALAERGEQCAELVQLAQLALHALQRRPARVPPQPVARAEGAPRLGSQRAHVAASRAAALQALHCAHAAQRGAPLPPQLLSQPLRALRRRRLLSIAVLGCLRHCRILLLLLLLLLFLLLFPDVAVARRRRTVRALRRRRVSLVFARGRVEAARRRQHGCQRCGNERRMALRRTRHAHLEHGVAQRTAQRLHRPRRPGGSVHTLKVGHAPSR